MPAVEHEHERPIGAELGESVHRAVAGARVEVGGAFAEIGRCGSVHGTAHSADDVANRRRVSRVRFHFHLADPMDNKANHVDPPTLAKCRYGSSPNSVPTASSIASNGSGRTVSPRSAGNTVVYPSALHRMTFSVASRGSTSQ